MCGRRGRFADAARTIPHRVVGAGIRGSGHAGAEIVGWTVATHGRPDAARHSPTDATRVRSTDAGRHHGTDATGDASADAVAGPAQRRHPARCPDGP
jgi:hypothetical protein